jgi:hypothetical protein
MNVMTAGLDLDTGMETAGFDMFLALILVQG